MKPRLFFVLAVLFVSSSWNTKPRPLFLGSLLEARQKSVEKKLPYLMIFEADWCSPCQWMEKFTYSDPELMEMMREDYAVVKMDIDEFEGYALKAQYEVKYLPTFLFFDTKNELIARYEKTVGPETMKSMLRWHRNFNREKFPSADMGMTSNAPIQKAARIADEPAIKPEPVEGAAAVSSYATNSYSTQSTEAMPVVVDKFTIQLGAFSSSSNASKLKRRIEGLGLGAVRIRKVSGHRYAYRVTLDAYPDYASCSPVLFQLDKLGFKGLVKKLDQFD